MCHVPWHIKAHGLLLSGDSHAGHFGNHLRVQLDLRGVSVFSYGEHGKLQSHMNTFMTHKDIFSIKQMQIKHTHNKQ